VSIRCFRSRVVLIASLERVPRALTIALGARSMAVQLDPLSFRRIALAR
jgi:hypothetical protein